MLKTLFAKEKNRYFTASLIVMLVSNRLIFWVGHLLGLGRPHFDLSLPVDALFPFLPWTIVIYHGYNLWCLYLYWVIARRDRRDANRFFCSQLLAKAISFLFFVFLPTTMTRAELSGNSIWIVLMRHLYQIDTPDNLFPSIHCVLGWHGWIAVRRNKDYPLWLRGTSLVLGVAVCLSTLTVRQHVLADVISGILLSECCFWLSKRDRIRGVYAALADRLARCFVPR